MRHLLISPLLCLACIGAAATAATPTPEAPIATVNGVAISVASAELLAAQSRKNGVPPSAQTQADIKADLIRRELLWQEAKKRGIDQRPAVRARAEHEKKLLLAQAEMTYQAIVVRELLKDFYSANPVTEAQLKEAYRKMTAAGGGQEYKARHIVVASSAESHQLLSALQAGGDFGALARKHSLDTGTRDEGGDLGWGTATKFPQVVSQALSTMKPGDTLRHPVQTGSGYHLLHLDDKRPAQPLAFESMRPLLEQQLQEQAAAELMARLHRTAKVQ